MVKRHTISKFKLRDKKHLKVTNVTKVSVNVNFNGLSFTLLPRRSKLITLPEGHVEGFQNLYKNKLACSEYALKKNLKLTNRNKYEMLVITEDHNEYHLNPGDVLELINAISVKFYSQQGLFVEILKLDDEDNEIEEEEEVPEVEKDDDEEVDEETEDDDEEVDEEGDDEEEEAPEEGEDEEEDREERIHQLMKENKLAQLQSMCKKFKLDTDGTKMDLATRIVDYQDMK